MDYVKPDQVVGSMVQSGAAKAALGVKDALLRGFLGGAILAFATTLAYTAAAQTKLPLIGALVFPIGFVIIILLGLELVTGSFALIPLAVLEKKATVRSMLANFFWVILGHLLGSAVYAALFYAAVTNFGHIQDQNVIQTIIKTAETKTNGYAALGYDGLAAVFAKAVLCNWMVTLGAVMAMTAQSTSGKILAMWLPILTFFAQGFEHAVVNMFVIPAGMMYGANVTLGGWWLWNQLPVLLGNFAGGLIFTGLFLYYTHSQKKKSSAAEPAASAVPGKVELLAAPAAHRR
ncbi:formate/nitrite transporter family protein [Paenibacillus mucilaginosus]|uniref:Formate/nitrite transporter n=3 Tax=Paenibacillus mucilaginosus TaxID=61624 RepID=H6NIJ0_9BACL|nr:formate/nitrite transporter family protein [Paenibacillus mucilaginosus]AEI42699.1 formate/nitrite transporter [Paenibacillus mucilaginosus KNP414]AFC32301.1 formate/nitrite transporter [Paenibacillus mucilaginosus 3016]AFH64607.1 formate transporter [Paenibacillus mucilaginosus K02]MCG7217055.1 formate/nitrite transporter family protein [Paenibacillus mucilaginosus]WDM26083.1 formate/nitrite transporter family protein [Paenibacillus mucilaginosus]